LTIRPQHNPTKLYNENNPELKNNESDEIVLTRDINKQAVTSKKSPQQNGESKYVPEIPSKQANQSRNSIEKQTPSEQKTSIVVRNRSFYSIECCIQMNN